MGEARPTGEPRRGRACAWPTACRCSSATRRPGTSRRSTRAGAASSPASSRAGVRAARRRRPAQAASSRRSGRASAPCCFEVGRDVAEQIARASPCARDASAATRRTSTCAPRCAPSSRRARASTTRASTTSPAARSTRPARFHSFRRDGANSGRMLAAHRGADDSPHETDRTPP